MILIGAMFRSGDQPAIRRLRVVRKLAVNHVVRDKIKTMPAQQACEHIGIVAEIALDLVRGVAGLQDADFHGSPVLEWA